MPTKAGPIFQCWQRKAFIPYLKTSRLFPTPTFTICLVASFHHSQEMVLLQGAKKCFLSFCLFGYVRLLRNCTSKMNVLPFILFILIFLLFNETKINSTDIKRGMKNGRMNTIRNNTMKEKPKIIFALFNIQFFLVSSFINIRFIKTLTFNKEHDV